MHRSLTLVARLLYSIPLMITGLIYLLKPQEALETLTSFIPGGLVLIYIAGFLWLIFAGLIALNIKTYESAWAIVVILCIYQVMIHVPALYTGEYMAIVAFELLRDLSLMGGAFFILTMYAPDEEETKPEHGIFDERNELNQTNF